MVQCSQSPVRRHRGVRHTHVQPRKRLLWGYYTLTPRSGPKVVNFHDAKTKTKTQYLHKCAVCGKTDLTDPQMEFRYCSRCNGYYCYCADHINNHIHIQ